MSSENRDFLLQAARDECHRTKQPVEVKFVKEVAYSNGKTVAEKYRYTFEFDPRGVPYPKLVQQNGRTQVQLIRGEPGVYLASMDSTVQSTLEKMDKDRRRNVPSKDTRKQNKGRKYVKK